MLTFKCEDCFLTQNVVWQSPLIWKLTILHFLMVDLSHSMRDLIPICLFWKKFCRPSFLCPLRSRIILIPRHLKTISPDPCRILDWITYRLQRQLCLSQICTSGAAYPSHQPYRIPYHRFRAKIDSLDIVIEPIATTRQLTDQFTKKGLGSLPFVNFCRLLMGWRFICVERESWNVQCQSTYSLLWNCTTILLSTGSVFHWLLMTYYDECWRIAISRLIPVSNSIGPKSGTSVWIRTQCEGLTWKGRATASTSVKVEVWR